MPDDPPVDVSQLAVLDAEGTVVRLKGDKEFLLTLFEVYRDDLPDKLASIRTALASGDLATVQRAAHSLKGASATVGATALRETAFALETAAKAEDAALCQSLQGFLDEQCRRVLDEIRTYLGQ